MQPIPSNSPVYVNILDNKIDDLFQQIAEEQAKGDQCSDMKIAQLSRQILGAMMSNAGITDQKKINEILDDQYLETVKLQKTYNGNISFTLSLAGGATSILAGALGIGGALGGAVGVIGSGGAELAKAVGTSASYVGDGTGRMASVASTNEEKSRIIIQYHTERLRNTRDDNTQSKNTQKDQGQRCRDAAQKADESKSSAFQAMCRV
jgi:hypothetical protein